MIDSLLFVVLACGSFRNLAWFNLEVFYQLIGWPSRIALAHSVFPDIEACIVRVEREMLARSNVINLQQLFGDWRQQGAF